MAAYSEKELVAWMGEEDDINPGKMFGWGIIAAMDRAKANRLLTQEYIRHFTEGSYIDPQSGTVDDNSGWVNTIENAVLDVPRLSFENSSVNNSKARLRMAMVAGNRVRIEKKLYSVVRTVEQYGPILRPELQIDLALNEVEGNVAAGGEIYLDLAKGTDFLFNFAGSPDEQAGLGRFFQKKFEALEEEKRVYQLGRIVSGGNEAMRPDQFKLLTHPLDPKNLDGEGAIISLIKLEGDREGSLPSSDNAIKYLIPNDAGKDYSATVMIASKRLAIAQMMQALREELPGVMFDINYQDVGGKPVVSGATLTKGSLTVGRQVEVLTGLSSFFKDLVAKVEIDDIICDLANNLSVEIDRKSDVINLACTLQGDIGYRLLELSSESGEFERVVEAINYDLTPLFEPRKDSFEYKISAGYKLVPEEGGRLENLHFDFDTVREPFPEHPEALRSAIDPDSGWEEFWFKVIVGVTAAYFAGVMTIIMTIVALAIVAPFKELEGDISMRGIIEKALKKSFPLLTPIKALIDDVIKFNFGNSLIADATHLPQGAVAFGRVNPKTTRFVINDLEPILGADQKHKFSTEPVKEGLTWRIESPAGHAGTITPDGEYIAPAAEHIDGLFTRVRVVATDGQFESSALVTVVRQGLMITPLVTTTWGNSASKMNPYTVDLQVGALDTSATFEWRFENPDPYGKLEDPGMTTPNMTYIAGPKSDGKAFSIDVVSARNTATGEKVESVIVTETSSQTMSLEIIDTNVDKGIVSLRAKVQNQDLTTETEWKVAHGPGSIVGGVYTVDTSESASFVVITGKYELLSFVFEGFIIIPLPLVENTRALEALHVKAN